MQPTGEFGELTTVEHKVNVDKDEVCLCVAHERVKGKRMLVILDVYSQWLQAYPVASRDHDQCLDRILTYFGPEYRPKVLWPRREEGVD